jgi:hypothetical protein
MNKRWGHFLILSVLFVAIVSVQVPDNPPEEKAASRPVMPKKEAPPTRAPSGTVNKRVTPDQVRIKKNKTPERRGIPHPALPDGHVLSMDIYAVKNYHPDQGELLEKRDGYHFIRAQKPPQQAASVVIDEYERLYTLNRVIKLRNISEQTRRELLDRGLSEHYYHPGLKVLYVEGPEDTLKFYEELQALDLKPEVELNRNFHRPK